jgi:hypothetical protein
MSELEVALDQYTHCCCRHLYRWNQHQTSNWKDCDVVCEWIAVGCYCARSQNHHLSVVWQLPILYLNCDSDWGEWYRPWCRSMSSSSKHTVDGNSCFVSKMKCRNHVKKYLDGLLVTHTIASQLVCGKSRTLIYCFQKEVLPLSQDFINPSSHVYNVFYYSLIFNIPWIMKRR